MCFGIFWYRPVVHGRWWFNRGFFGRVRCAYHVGRGIEHVAGIGRAALGGHEGGDIYGNPAKLISHLSRNGSRLMGMLDSPAILSACTHEKIARLSAGNFRL